MTPEQIQKAQGLLKQASSVLRKTAEDLTESSMEKQASGNTVPLQGNFFIDLDEVKELVHAGRSS